MSQMLVKPRGGNIKALLAGIGIPINDPSLGGLMKPGQEELAVASSIGDHVRLLFPSASNETLAKLDYLIDQRIEGHYAYFAGSFKAMQVALSKLPNCSVSLYLATGPDTAAASGTVYPLYPAVNGVSTGAPFAFTRGMWFGSLTTTLIDTAVGWRIAGNTAKFSDDIVSSMPQDVSFVAFESDLVFARTQLGVYAQRAFLSPINFQISAVHYRAATQVLIGGILMKYRDDRCYQGEIAEAHDAIFEPMPGGGSYTDALRELIATRASRFRRPGRSVGGLDRPWLDRD